MPKRIQLRRTKGWRMPPNTVSVARPSKWGNPWKVLPFTLCSTNYQAVELFKKHELPRLAKDLDELRGKNLACWCPPGVPCHADVLLELANA